MTNTDNGSAHFVHDFARVDLPLASVVSAIEFVATPAQLATFVVSAWSAEVRVLEAVQRQVPHGVNPTIDVVCGPQRTRSDAVILPLAWRTATGPWIPPLQADLEFAAFGPERTHVHVYGCSELPPGSRPASGPASMTQRLTVAMVRHVLTLLTRRVVELADDPATVMAVRSSRVRSDPST